MKSVFRSPKICRSSEGWYEYYAGYSEGFVDDVLSHLQLGVATTVLDPWNGSGTTTSVSHRRGHHAIGLDVNPALVVVGKARALDAGVLPSVSSLRADILQKAKRIRASTDAPARSDPLRWWFTADAAHRLRSLGSAIDHLLVEESQHPALGPTPSPGQMSTLAAFFYVVLFKTTRGFLGKFKTTNPTWIKRAPSKARLKLDGGELARSFRSHQESLAQRLSTSGVLADGCSKLEIRLGNAEQTGVPPESVHAVIGSPPYCTRIDYAVNTLPELAVLGIGADPASLKALRDSMTGTPTVSRLAVKKKSEQWGKACGDFLAEVAKHPSKASGSYYLKYYRQYFSSMSRSLEEAARVLVSNGSCVLVVQDSHYKDIHCNLQRIISEIGATHGLRQSDRFDFTVPHVRASMNMRARAYRTEFTSVESALILTKTA